MGLLKRRALGYLGITAIVQCGAWLKTALSTKTGGEGRWGARLHVKMNDVLLIWDCRLFTRVYRQHGKQLGVDPEHRGVVQNCVCPGFFQYNLRRIAQ